VARIELLWRATRVRPPSQTAPRPHRHDPIVRLDQIASAGEEKRRFLVRDEEHRFEAAKQAIGTPVARELHGGAFEVAAILFEL